MWMNSYVIFLKDTFFHHKIVLLQVLPFPLQVSQLTFRHTKQHKTRDCCELNMPHIKQYQKVPLSSGKAGSEEGSLFPMYQNTTNLSVSLIFLQFGLQGFIFVVHLLQQLSECISTLSQRHLLLLQPLQHKERK